MAAKSEPPLTNGLTDNELAVIIARVAQKVVKELAALNKGERRRPRKLGEDELLTTAEVAKMLRTTANAVRLLIDKGELPTTRIGGRYRIWFSDVQKLLDLNQIGRY